ncbi:hypothetical protein [Kluyvera georgiana]|uniref:hypothetical protein n=1 Tax=Kluyvera georgiana TaxID=73098 RepID=UPI003AEF8342
MAKVTFSSKVQISDFTLTSTEPKYTNQSWTGARIIRSTGIQYYTGQFTLNFNQADRLEVMKFIAQYSQGASFQFPLGHLGTYPGSYTGAISVGAAVARGISQFTTASTQALEIGTLIQFTNHKKLYRVIANTGTQITVFPSLQASIQLGENVFYDSLVIEMQFDDDNDFALPITNYATMTFKATEVVR